MKVASTMQVGAPEWLTVVQEKHLSVMHAILHSFSLELQGSGCRYWEGERAPAREYREAGIFPTA